MLDPNPEQFRIFDKFPFLTGVLLDPVTGPFTMSRPVATLRHSDTEKITEMNESATEDIYSENELDARYAGFGWPSPSRLPSKPGDVSTLGAQSSLGNGNWASRRFMVQRVSINLSAEDLRPVDSFVEAVEAALNQETNVLQIQDLRRVFATWGEVIPLNMVAGASLATTGALNGPALPNSIGSPNRPVGVRSFNLNDIVDQRLGTSGSFIRRVESRVQVTQVRRHIYVFFLTILHVQQGGSSEVLLNEGYEAWLNSVAETPASWRVIKIFRVIPITDILGDKLRTKVEQLFANSLIYRSPSVGSPHGFGFEGVTNSLRTIERITVWFSDSRIRDISIRYVGGLVTGPYAFANSNPQSPSDVLVLGSGEYVTDMFVWHHTDGWIAGIQFVKSSMECSPIYGIRDRQSVTTYPPVLLSGNGNALLGMSGTFTSDNICQLKAIWRSDVVMKRQRQTQTSFTGSNYGNVFNDLQYLADPATARIAQITARAEGGLANLRLGHFSNVINSSLRIQTTYVSVVGRGLYRSETPPRGWDTGPESTITLEDGEYIIGVRGSHNHHWMHQIQFITNKKEHPPLGTDKGNVLFSIDAPKTIDGKTMILHYMAGKSEGCVHSILFVWAEMPLSTKGYQSRMVEHVSL
ncbi:unnamed protein product [Rhizoctonia solani]|uniref:Jacalin-type lectin domain-containing protein n=1 Tax=Rhizoctonia solani TaxID=456999 RepID=A0A8H3DQV8_9AGAM|nr:unnamed protein product [Rhizoctonia solani]